MDSQKNENLLNLALDTGLVERERSLELNVGYDVQEETWEVIVKYHGGVGDRGGGVDCGVRRPHRAGVGDGAAGGGGAD